MMQKSTIFTVCIIFGAAVGEPIRLASKNVLTEQPIHEMAARTDVLSVIDIISSLIGYKISALSCAIHVVQWAVSNISVIIIGAATVIGFCKLTGKCTLNYEEYIPMSQIQSYATPENLDAAERLLLTAVEKYSEERKRSLD